MASFTARLVSVWKTRRAAVHPPPRRAPLLGPAWLRLEDRVTPAALADYVLVGTAGTGGNYSYEMAKGDFNGDGHIDLVVTNGGSNTVGVLLSNGDGTFQPVATYSTGGNNSYSVAVGDFNGDGNLDLAVTNYSSSTVGILKGNGNGTFQSAVTYLTGGSNPYSVAVGDFNGDGKPDLAVVNYAYSGSVGILLNKGDGSGTFQTAVTYSTGGYYPQAITVSDIDGDGHADLVVANVNSNTVGILKGNGDGTFQTAVTYSTGGNSLYSVAVGDFNGDGKPDLAVVNYDYSGSVGILLNKGDGTFQTAVTYFTGGYYPQAITVSDIDGDGDSDLLVVNSSTIGLLLNNGDGTFGSATAIGSGVPSPRSVAILGDLDGDGHADLAVLGSGGTVGILLYGTNATITTLSAPALPTVTGESATFTVTVAPVDSRAVPPTGSVYLYNGGSSIGSASLDSTGTATITVNFQNPLLPGTYSNITAVYSDGNFADSTSNAVSHTVNRADVTLTLTGPTAATTYGQPVTLTATLAVTPPGSVRTSGNDGGPSYNTLAPTGYADFYDGATFLGRSALLLEDYGRPFSITTALLPAGERTDLHVVYSGDANYNTGSSPPITQTVNAASTTTQLQGPGSAIVAGQLATFTATVNVTAPGAGTPTGTVTFKDGSTVLGTAVLSGGVAVFSTTGLTAGPHAITAEYNGGGSFTGSTSAIVPQAVNPNTTTTTVTASASTATQGDMVTFVAAVTPDAPATAAVTGIVTFTDGTTLLGTAPLVNGMAVLNATGLAVGNRTITATFASTANSTGSSGTTSVTVNAGTAPGRTASTVALSVSPDLSVFGQSVTFTATVAATGGTPTGMVVFRSGSTFLGMSPLDAGGVATLTVTTLPVGVSSSLTADYGGDPNFLPASTATAQSNTVVKAGTTVGVVSSAVSGSTYGQVVTFVATVEASAPGIGTPTGTVTFQDGTTVLGTVTLSGGVAAFSTAGLAIGPHSIAVVYNGDGNFTGSTSAAVTQTVNATLASPPVIVGGSDGTMHVLNPDGSVAGIFTPFPSFTGEIRTAATGDGNAIVGTGPGAVNQVKVIDPKTQAVVFALSPFETAFTGGVFVSSGDLLGTGAPQVIVSPDQGGGPRVQIRDGQTGAVLMDFFGIDDPNFRGGARTAVADVNGDHIPDLIVAAGIGGGPRVTIYDGAALRQGKLQVMSNLFVFEQSLRNGVYVTAGDLNGDGYADLIVGGGPGGGPRVFAISGKDLAAGAPEPAVLANFFAGDTSNRSGVRIAVKNLDGDQYADLLTAPGPGGGTRVTAYAGKDIQPNGTPPVLFSYDTGASGLDGVFVG